MATGSSLVKKMARTALKGKWTASVFAVCIPLFIIFICYYSATVLSVVTGKIIATVFLFLLTVFLTMPVCLGVFRYFWRILFAVDDSPISVFYYFSDIRKYRRALSLLLILAFKVIIYGFLLNIPLYILNIISHSFLYELIGISLPVWTANLVNVKIILRVISQVILISLLLKFYLAPMLFVSDDNMEPAEAVHMSSVISKKSSVDFIYLGFSFLGWIILSFFVVPLIFTIPYIAVSYFVHARIAVSEYNLHIEQMNKYNSPSFTV